MKTFIPLIKIDLRLFLLAGLLIIMPARGGVASALVPVLLLFLLPVGLSGQMPPRRLLVFALLGALTIAHAAWRAISLDRGDAGEIIIKVASGMALLLLTPLLFSPRAKLAYAKLRAQDWQILAAALGAGLVFSIVALFGLKLWGEWPKVVEKFDRGLSYAAILTPVLGMALPRRRAYVLLVLSLAAAMSSNSATSQLANLSALSVLLIYYWRPAWAPPLIAAGFTALNGMVLSVCLWPASWYEWLKQFLPYSWVARLDIWHFVGQHAPDAPWRGQGWSTTHFLELTHDWNLLLTTKQAHPHNAALQSLVELGLPGLLLLITSFGFALFIAAAAREPARRAAGLAALSASVVVAGFGFDFIAGSLWSAMITAAVIWYMAPVHLSNQSGMIGTDRSTDRNFST